VLVTGEVEVKLLAELRILAEPLIAKVGDVIEITLGSKSVKVKVTEVKEVVRKEDAATMYEAAV
jgi:ribosomal 50S subunit-recycling heat shock protein